MRPLVTSGLAYEDINSSTNFHIPQMYLNRTQNPVTRAVLGDEAFNGAEDPHRRALAVARYRAGAAPDYWKSAVLQV